MKRSVLQHNPILDGMRGVAILLVVWLHVWELTWYSLDKQIGSLNFPFDLFARSGNWGVELFFFVSGFCLMNGQKTKQVALQRFFTSRALKIMPSYFLAMTAAIVLFGVKFDSVGSWMKQLLTHLTFTHSLSQDTFESFFGVMWSLSIEVQFYAIFPLIYKYFRKAPHSTFSAAILLSLTARWFFNSIYPGDWFFMRQLPTYLDVFLAGMYASWWLRYMEHKNISRVKATAVALLSVIIFAAVFNFRRHLFSSATPAYFNHLIYLRTALGLIFIAFAISATFAFPVFKSVVANSLLRFLSTISYSLYLWHQQIGRFLVERYKSFAKTEVPMHDALWGEALFILSIALSLVIATALTYLFEKPFLRLKDRLVGKRFASAITSKIKTEEVKKAA